MRDDVREIAQELFYGDVDLVEFINHLIYMIVENDAPTYIDEVNEEQVSDAIDSIIDSIIEQIQNDVHRYKLGMVEKLMKELTEAVKK